MSEAFHLMGYSNAPTNSSPPVGVSKATSGSIKSVISKVELEISSPVLPDESAAIILTKHSFEKSIGTFQM